MKIRCIDTDNEKLTLNKEYEVIKSDNYWYWFIDDIGGHNGYRKSLFEIVEEKNRLNIIEAMKMPVGTEFEVIFNGEKIENNTMIIYRSLEGDNERKHMDWKSHPQDTYMKPYDFLINGIFIPIEKSVSFMDVVNSDKRCRVEYPNAPDGYWFLDDMLYWLGNEYSSESCAEIIKNGKWYLED